MPHEDLRRQEAAAWLAKAATDLRSGEHALTAAPPLIEDALFHCQQAVEKALKAFLAWHDVPFRRTHSIEELGEQCLQVDATLQSLVDSAILVSPYAWLYRYPSIEPAASLDQASEGLSVARRAYQAIARRLA